MFRSREFDKATNVFKRPPLEEAMVGELIDKYLLQIKKRVVYQTYINYSSVFRAFKDRTNGLRVARVDKEFIRVFLAHSKY